MTSYLCNDGNGEVTIEADSAREAAQEYVDGGSWGEIEKTIWINVSVAEVIECDHPNVEDGVVGSRECDECGELCSAENLGAREDGLGPDDECPIHHGSVRKTEDVGTIKIAIDPEEPDCTESEHNWQSPYEIVEGIEEHPGVWGHGGGVIVREVCMQCGCERVTNTWAQDPEDGKQGLTSIAYEPGKYADEVAALASEDE